MTILKVIFRYFHILKFFEVFFWILILKFFEKNFLMVPRWCSRDDVPNSNFWSKTTIFFEQNEIHEKSSCCFRTMNLHSAIFSSLFSFNLKFWKPIGYTVCIPTNGRRLMLITCAAEDCQPIRIESNFWKNWKIKEDAAPDENFFPNFFRLFQSPLFLLILNLLIFEHFWTFLTRFIS